MHGRTMKRGLCRVLRRVLRRVRPRVRRCARATARIGACRRDFGLHFFQHVAHDGVLRWMTGWLGKILNGRAMRGHSAILFSATKN